MCSLPVLRIVSVPTAERVSNYWNHLIDGEDALFPALSPGEWPFCISLGPWGPWKQTPLKTNGSFWRDFHFLWFFIHPQTFTEYLLYVSPMQSTLRGTCYKVKRVFKKYWHWDVKEWNKTFTCPASASKGQDWIPRSPFSPTPSHISRGRACGVDGTL